MQLASASLIGRNCLPSKCLTPCIPPVYPLYTSCIARVINRPAPGSVLALRRLWSRHIRHAGTEQRLESRDYSPLALHWPKAAKKTRKDWRLTGLSSTVKIRAGCMRARPQFSLTRAAPVQAGYPKTKSMSVDPPNHECINENLHKLPAAQQNLGPCSPSSPPPGRHSTAHSSRCRLETRLRNHGQPKYSGHAGF